jgi:hypothetical protein
LRLPVDAPDEAELGHIADPESYNPHGRARRPRPGCREEQSTAKTRSPMGPDRLAFVRDSARVSKGHQNDGRDCRHIDC